MPLQPGQIFALSTAVLCLVVYGIFSIRILRSKYGPIRTVKATVVDKNRIEQFSKYSGNGKAYRYAVVFEAGGKRISFYVSEFSYGGYRIGEKGTLKYRGHRLIDFH